MASENKPVPLSKSRVFITLILHLMVGVPSAFLPEENVSFWVSFNLAFAVILAIINYFIWLSHNQNSKRYFSLHSLVMMMGLAFYAITPVMKGLYPSVFFCILLLILIGFSIFLFSKYEEIGKAFLNPKKKMFKTLVMVYAVVFLSIGGTMFTFMLGTQTANWIPVAMIFFFGGLFFLMISPAMLVKPEQAKEFELGRD